MDMPPMKGSATPRSGQLELSGAKRRRYPPLRTHRAWFYEQSDRPARSDLPAAQGQTRETPLIPPILEQGCGSLSASAPPTR